MIIKLLRQGLTRSRRSSSWRRHVGSILVERADRISKVTRALLIGRVCRLLGIMIDSGVPLLDSLRLARVLGKEFRLSGSCLSSWKMKSSMAVGWLRRLLESEFVPGSAGEMVATAEKTGTLGMVTRMIGQHFEEEGEAKLKGGGCVPRTGYHRCDGSVRRHYCDVGHAAAVRFVLRRKGLEKCRSVKRD